MSTRYVEFEIVDGENALALISQLLDLVRGHTGPRFKIKIRRTGFNFNGGRLHGRQYHEHREFGVNITGLTTTDGDAWEIHGNLDDELLAEQLWLKEILVQGDYMALFEGTYDVNKRNGYIRFYPYE